MAVRLVRMAPEARVAVVDPTWGLLVAGVAEADAGRVAVDRASRARQLVVPRPVVPDGPARLAQVLEVGTA